MELEIGQSPSASDPIQSPRFSNLNRYLTYYKYYEVQDLEKQYPRFFWLRHQQSLRQCASKSSSPIAINLFFKQHTPLYVAPTMLHLFACAQHSIYNQHCAYNYGCIVWRQQQLWVRNVAFHMEQQLRALVIGINSLKQRWVADGQTNKYHFK